MKKQIVIKVENMIKYKYEGKMIQITPSIAVWWDCSAVCISLAWLNIATEIWIGDNLENI